MIKTNRLPKEYQEVEYIASSGTQYIDTGVTISGNDKYIIDIYFNNTSDVRWFGNLDSLTIAWKNNYLPTRMNNTWSDIYSTTISTQTKHTIEANISSTGYSIYCDGTLHKQITGYTITANNNNLYLFKAKGTGIYNGLSGRIYSAKLYKNDTLVRHLIPCYRKSDNVIGMYDIINNVFYTNTGTGTFDKGNDVQVKVKNIKIYKNNTTNEVMYIKTKVNNSMVKIYDELPSEYQRVEYIETSGTQYIDTGIYPSTNTQIETNIEVTTTSQDTSVFGCFQNTGSNSLGAYYHLTPYNSKWYFGGNGRESNGGTYSPVVGTKYNIVFNNSNGYISINDSIITTDVSFVGYTSSTLTISRRGQINNPRYGKYKYFKFKVFDKNTNKYIADYVPCYRKIDNVIGLYDLVNDVFHTNAGSGTFSKGNNI